MESLIEVISAKLAAKEKTARTHLAFQVFDTETKEVYNLYLKISLFMTMIDLSLIENHYVILYFKLLYQIA
jgi:hypothetical protein